MLTASLSVNTAAFDVFAQRMRQTLQSPVEDGKGLGGGAVAATHVYADAMRERFKAASAGDGTWPPLAPSTAKRRARKSPDGVARILWVTGELFESLTPGSESNVFELMADRVRYGTSNPIAKYHQQGGRNLPQRRILVEPSQELLVRCIAPIQASWRSVIKSHVTAANTAR